MTTLEKLEGNLTVENLMLMVQREPKTVIAYILNLRKRIQELEKDPGGWYQQGVELDRFRNKCVVLQQENEKLKAAQKDLAEALFNAQKRLEEIEERCCTCKPSCPTDCKGDCGCKKCAQAYGDWLSVE
jgi:uncharacterized alpha-E superfamily protein